MRFGWLRYASIFQERLNGHCLINKKLGYENEIGKCSDDEIWGGGIKNKILGDEHKNEKCSYIIL